MHTPQRPNGDIFNRMVSGAAYMPDAECAAQTKRIHAATVLAEEHYARGEQAQAMHVYRDTSATWASTRTSAPVHASTTA